MQVDPGRVRGAPVCPRQRRPARSKVRPRPLDVLARVEPVRLEVGTVAGVRSVEASAKVNTIREPRRALDDQIGSVLRSYCELLSPSGGLPFFQGLRSGDVRVGVAVDLESGVRRDRYLLIRGQPLAKNERSGDLMLARVTPGWAAAAVLECSSFLPQCDLEVVSPTADDGRNTLLGANEVSDPRLARVTRPLPQRLSLCIAQEPIHYAYRDHPCLAPSSRGACSLGPPDPRPLRRLFYARRVLDGVGHLSPRGGERSPDRRSAGLARSRPMRSLLSSVRTESCW